MVILFLVVMAVIGFSFVFWGDKQQMAPELIYIMGGICGAVFGSTLPVKFLNLGVRISLAVAAACAWGWLLIQLLEQL